VRFPSLFERVEAPGRAKKVPPFFLRELGPTSSVLDMFHPPFLEEAPSFLKGPGKTAPDDDGQFLFPLPKLTVDVPPPVR